MSSFRVFRPSDYLLFFLAGMAAWGFSAADGFYRALERPFRTPAAPSSITIQRGGSAKTIARTLEKEGLCPSRRHFLAAAWLDQSAARLQAGEYDASVARSPREWAEAFALGQRQRYRVTVPEGWTVRQIADRLEQAGLLQAADFQRAASEATLLRRYAIEAPSAEGYLFPETYIMEKPLSATAVVEMMIREFRQQTASLGPLDHDRVVLASIIEKEAQRPEDMKRVSAVFHNRLRLGWPLQSDATLQFSPERRAVPEEGVAEATASLYNTYRNPGIPPGALCNPGWAALDAAIHPVSGEWLFFQSDREGRFYFSNTHREHLKIKRQLRREQDSISP
jgi:UPF0755 protein